MDKQLTVSKGRGGVDNTARRKWDKEDYATKAKERDKKEAEAEESALDAKKRKRLERDPLHQGIIVQRSHLKARSYSLNLEARLGKTQVVTPNTPLNQQAGYYCNVCDCILRDSATYLDHINGKWHQRALGMSMRVERSTAQDVKKRLEEHKNQKYQATDVDTVADGFDRRVLEAEEEAERQREERREKKKEKKKAAEDDDGGEEGDPDMMALMGFGGFGTSSKKR
uniref:U4/U6.U5 tri-snRNP component SNU23 n=1 Tax=Tetraselmis sp. GSL018 TaxID=582737 RepID=A0A061S4H3_9CHLO|mmetsp:Transcript_23088/g.55238  ORF Transcript_23088/g.55238 Transcript_23088/m.55238 type:complete len:226 (+) Transcript_23088:163-840(+)|eukprot:CAMPEP_0177613708 /NCGR_PEP_ID=MMETSP0419_2-20121207/22176_1 /TAXON_ID=582737 /ORGANISM="Tetraselmis sp., Strain GSL018" /LENGTH=225 /DNA_ID=CAMNT_0019110537 /DNA_START=111 /DNA_END=788 /DNA_ORIENTATION=+